MNAKQLVAHMAGTFKTCEVCRQTKALLHFYKQKDAPDGTMTWSGKCKVCIANKSDARYKGPVDPRGTEYIEVVVPLKQSRRWTAEEDAVVRENLHELTATLCLKLRRTAAAVDARRRMLKDQTN